MTPEEHMVRYDNAKIMYNAIMRMIRIEGGKLKGRASFNPASSVQEQDMNLLRLKLVGEGFEIETCSVQGNNYSYEVLYDLTSTPSSEHFAEFVYPEKVVGLIYDLIDAKSGELHGSVRIEHHDVDLSTLTNRVKARLQSDRWIVDMLDMVMIVNGMVVDYRLSYP